MPIATMVMDKRADSRVSKHISVRYQAVHNEIEIATSETNNENLEVSHSENVSLGGLYLITMETLKVGALLRLHISLPEKLVFITTLARVTWTDQKGAGIHFLALKNEDMESLSAFIHEPQ